MYDFGHFCLLIIAHEKWKPHFSGNLLEKLNKKFLPLLEPRSKQEEIKIGWNETPKEPLFDPQNYEKCQTCIVLKPSFENKKGVNDGLILFSHSLPDRVGVKTFLAQLFEERRIKKVYYLELGFGEELKQNEVSDIKHEQLSISEITQLIEQNKLVTKILYDILRLKY